MTAWDLRDMDQEAIQEALRSIELPAIDLTRLSRLRDDLAAFDRPHVDLSRLELPSVDLSHLDLGRFGRRPSKQSLGFLAVRPTPLFFLGLLAALGGLLAGAVLAWFMHPAQGPKRRRWLKRRLGLTTARPGGKAHRHGHGGGSDHLIAVPIETDTPAQDQPDTSAPAPEASDDAVGDSVADVAAEQPAAD